MSLGNRIKELIDNKGITPYAVSNETGISQSTLSRILNNSSKKTNIENTKLLAKYFGVSKDWLLTGKGEKIESKKNSNAIQVDFSEMSIMFVPLVGQYAYAGFLNGFADEEYIDQLPKIPFADGVEHKGKYLCFEVKGDSMDNDTADSYLEGDILLCRNVEKDYWKSKLHINKWDFVIVHETEGVLVKRIIKHDVETGNITIHSLNDFYEDIVLNLKDVHLLFNVVDVRRKKFRR